MSGFHPSRQRIGLLGGTFDPIHFGHLRLAQELTDTLALDTLRFIPAANPPHRQLPAVTATQRAAMVQLALAGNPKLVLDRCELQRTGTSYSIDTVLALRQQFGPDTALCMVMGSDAFIKFDTWHRWHELLAHCHLVLVARPNTPLQGQLSDRLQALLSQHLQKDLAALGLSPSGAIIMPPITALDISATAIRACLRQQKSPRYLLPDAVLDYIQCHRLYASSVI